MPANDVVEPEFPSFVDERPRLAADYLECDFRVRHGSHRSYPSGDVPEHWPKRAPRGWQLAVPVEDRFDVVPVRVNDERCVIPGVVLRAKTRRAVVAATGFDSGAVELVNSGSVGCGEGHMNGSGRRFPFPDPEISTALDCEPRPLRALHYLHAERLEGLLVEGAAAS
jgi:hypothetical protein